MDGFEGERKKQHQFRGTLPNVQREVRTSLELFGQITRQSRSRLANYSHLHRYVCFGYLAILWLARMFVRLAWFGCLVWLLVTCVLGLLYVL